MLTLLSDFRNIVILLLLIAVGCLYFCYKDASYHECKYKEENKSLQDAINQQNGALNDMKYDANERQRRIQELESKWTKRNKEVKKESDAIMKYTVPKGCEDAIKWGNLEAIKLNLHE